MQYFSKKSFKPNGIRKNHVLQKILKGKGYQTSLLANGTFGIWSDSCHCIRLDQYFWNSRNPMTWLPCSLTCRDNKVEESIARSTTRQKFITEESLKFIDQTRSKSTHFCLYLATINPDVPIYAHQTFRANLLVALCVI